MEEFLLADEEKAFLLKLARDTIRLWLTEAAKPEPETIAEALMRPCGAFVTLTTPGGELRGCIGHVVAAAPLYKTVIDAAISAATQDPRFPPVRPEELDRITIELSVLSPLTRIASPDEIRVGVHGLMVTKGFSKGLLLPQVGARYDWDAETFLEHTCRKAGLPRDAWRSGAVIEVFTALVFGEEG